MKQSLNIHSKRNEATLIVMKYIRSGIIGFSGCTLVANNFGEYKKGWAFYISFVASCYVILQVRFSIQLSKNNTYFKYLNMLILFTISLDVVN